MNEILEELAKWRAEVKKNPIALGAFVSDEMKAQIDRLPKVEDQSLNLFASIGALGLPIYM